MVFGYVTSLILNEDLDGVEAMAVELHWILDAYILESLQCCIAPLLKTAVDTIRSNLKISSLKSLHWNHCLKHSEVTLNLFVTSLS